MDTYRLSCSEVGGMNCNFSTTADTVEEMKQKMFAHAGQVHREMLASMTEAQKAEVNRKIDSLLAKQTMQTRA